MELSWISLSFVVTGVHIERMAERGRCLHGNPGCERQHPPHFKRKLRCLGASDLGSFPNGLIRSLRRCYRSPFFRTAVLARTSGTFDPDRNKAERLRSGTEDRPSEPRLLGVDSYVSEVPLLAELRPSKIAAPHACLRIASSAARARNPDRVSPCVFAWASIARRIRWGNVMLILAALSPSSLASTSTTAHVQPR